MYIVFNIVLKSKPFDILHKFGQLANNMANYLIHSDSFVSANRYARVGYVLVS